MRTGNLTENKNSASVANLVGQNNTGASLSSNSINKTTTNPKAVLQKATKDEARPKFLTAPIGEHHTSSNTLQLQHVLQRDENDDAFNAYSRGGYNQDKEEKYRPRWQPAMDMVDAAKISGGLGLFGAQEAGKLGLSGAKKSANLGLAGAKASGELGLEGAKKSLGMGAAGAEASYDLAAAPARWAQAGAAGTDSKLKKAGYYAAGGIGSLFSGAAGAVGAIGSGALGLVGALGSGALGAAGAIGSGALGVAGAAGSAAAGTTGAIAAGTAGATGGLLSGIGAGLGFLGGGISLGAKKAWAALGGVGKSIKSFWGGKDNLEKGRLGMLGAGGAATAGAQITDLASKGQAGQNLLLGSGIVKEGFKSDLKGAAGAFVGLGAGASILGAGSALLDVKRAGASALDADNSVESKGAAVLEGTAALADATKSAATAAYNIASLIDLKGAAAAGAQVAAGGASIAMGVVEMLRGGFSIWRAGNREKELNQVLESIEKNSPNSEVKAAANIALGKQNIAKASGGLQIFKGAALVAGGVLLAATAATPIGWILLTGAALVGVASLIMSWYKNKGRRKEVVKSALGVTPDQIKKHEDKIAAVKERTGIFTNERKNQIAGLGPDPLTEALENNQEKPYKGGNAVDEYYNDYTKKAADHLFTAAVNGDSEAIKVIEQLGFKFDSEKQQPKPEKIKKALE